MFPILMVDTSVPEKLKLNWYRSRRMLTITPAEMAQIPLRKNPAIPE
jgi:hypothetical protein